MSSNNSNTTYDDTDDAPERGPGENRQQNSDAAADGTAATGNGRQGGGGPIDTSGGTGGTGGTGTGDPDWMDADAGDQSDADLTPKEQEEMWDEVVRGTDSAPEENPTAYFPVEGRGELEFEITPLPRRKMSALKRRYPPGMLRAIQQEENGEEPEFTPDMNPTEEETDALETTVKRSFHHPKISPHQLQQYMDQEWGEAALFKAATLAMAISSASAGVQDFRVEQ